MCEREIKTGEIHSHIYIYIYACIYTQKERQRQRETTSLALYHTESGWISLISMNPTSLNLGACTVR